MTDKIHLYHPLHTLKPFSDGIQDLLKIHEG